MPSCVHMSDVTARRGTFLNVAARTCRREVAMFVRWRATVVAIGRSASMSMLPYLAPIDTALAMTL